VYTQPSIGIKFIEKLHKMSSYEDENGLCQAKQQQNKAWMQQQAYVVTKSNS
jgi:hypothetical protein